MMDLRRYLFTIIKVNNREGWIRVMAFNATFDNISVIL